MGDPLEPLSGSLLRKIYIIILIILYTVYPPNTVIYKAY